MNIHSKHKLAGPCPQPIPIGSTDRVFCEVSHKVTNQIVIGRFSSINKNKSNFNVRLMFWDHHCTHVCIYKIPLTFTNFHPPPLQLAPNVGQEIKNETRIPSFPPLDFTLFYSCS